MAIIFIPNEAGIKATIATPSSIVGINMARRGEAVAKAARATNLYNDCTGGLRSSTYAKPVKGGEGPEVEIIADTEYAIFVHEGRGPVSIKNANWLAIRRQCQDGRRVFAKSVGPAAARPFLREALQAASG